jgi:hypothetical protein
MEMELDDELEPDPPVVQRAKKIREVFEKWIYPKWKECVRVKQAKEAREKEEREGVKEEEETDLGDNSFRIDVGAALERFEPGMTLSSPAARSY